MREILFKGKRIDNDEWVYGSLFVDLCYGGIPEYYIEYIEYGSLPYRVSKRVNGETVGQYAGLTDKNGTKIFEGDIVSIVGMIGKVVYEYGSFGIGLSEGIDYKKLEKKTVSWLGIENDNFLPLLEVYWNFNDEDEVLSEVKVIGNIYDNPELFEEK